MNLPSLPKHEAGLSWNPHLSLRVAWRLGGLGGVLGVAYSRLRDKLPPAVR